MWYRSFCSCLVICGLCFVGMDANGQQDTTASKNDAFANVLKKEVRGLSQTSIDEIIEIRKRLGGGTGLGDSDLVGLGNNSWTSDLFTDSKSILDHHKPAPRFAKTQSEKLFFEMLQNIEDLDVKQTVTKSARTKDRIADIRATARRIDELAADLEELELFGDADELRALATDIRAKARPKSRTANSGRRMR